MRERASVFLPNTRRAYAATLAKCLYFLNYYDDRALQEAITPFVITWLRALIKTGMRTDVVFCIGTGKNFAYLESLNSTHRFFERIVPLEHPRFIMQYKAKSIDAYARKYVQALSTVIK